MCSDCYSGRKKRPGAYVQKLLLFRNLKAAKCPVDKNDLTIDEWQDMNNIEAEFHNIFKNKK